MQDILNNISSCMVAAWQLLNNNILPGIKLSDFLIWGMISSILLSAVAHLLDSD